MRGPIKKRKIEFVNTPVQLSKIVFSLVFPWLFPGHWKTKNEGFKTLLRLAGTCRQLRYFQRLRRVIVQLAPHGLMEKLRDHGFPAQFSVNFWMDLIECKSYASSTFYFYPEHAAGMIPVNFEVATFCDLAKRSVHGRSTLVFYAPSFAEMVLFVYAAAVMKDEQLERFDAIEIVFRLKRFCYETISFETKKRQEFVKRQALGALKRVGLMAPRDFEFERGALPETAYSFFCKVCETSGKKDGKKPLERLKAFVDGWYPATANSVGPGDAKKRSYNFAMVFEK